MATTQSGALGRQRLGSLRVRSRVSVVRRNRTALLEADFLDRLVDAELEFVRRLPVHQRSKPAEAIAVLVMLAQDHRHYAQGWISRRQLRHRAQLALVELDALREATIEEQG